MRCALYIHEVLSELYHVGGSSHFTQTHGSSVPGVDACSTICLVCLLD